MLRQIPLLTAYHSAAMAAAAAEVLQSGQVASGPYVETFRHGFGSLVGSQNLVTTSDMSSAIQIALRLSGVGAGDEVLTTSYNCMSSNAPIAWAGARPAWVDVDPRTGLMDPASLERSITARSKACLLYHVAGYPAPVQDIAGICKRAGIPLIEDCNNALLATVQNRQVGTFGDYAVHSFYPNRQINAADGGALVCKDADATTRATHLRRFGIDPGRFRDSMGEIDPLCDIPEIGWSCTMNNLCSALGQTQLDSVRERLLQTRQNAQLLCALLEEVPGASVVRPGPNSVPAYWALLVQVERRDEVLEKLKSAGVMASKLHHTTDQYTGFPVAPRQLPGTTQFMNRVIALPCGWWLSEEDPGKISTALREAIEAVGNCP